MKRCACPIVQAGQEEEKTPARGNGSWQKKRPRKAIRGRHRRCVHGPRGMEATEPALQTTGDPSLSIFLLVAVHGDVSDAVGAKPSQSKSVGGSLASSSVRRHWQRAGRARQWLASFTSWPGLCLTHRRFFATIWRPIPFIRNASVVGTCFISSTVSYPRRLSSPRSFGFLSPKSESFVFMVI